ncbi:MAG: TonB-dependent receptor [Phenylobacterium sp.]|uniref:TonB-dependent receptor n=1 Tax=Phenylobacterium sp. TaxID=1871053 RepID=UPI0025D196D7|nr:TonB-dependent receptor [Phenylobacterium sp.]MBI1198182.1 TonB-dependent receptor [Phenylobacterium sp.]
MQHIRRLAGLAAAVGALAPPSARAAETVAFAIPEQPRAAALIALARQAGLSLGFAPDARCAGQAGVTGRLSVDAALQRLLAGSSCLALRPDARTIVVRARAAPSTPAARPSTAAEPASPRPPAEVGELVVTADKTETLLSASPYGLTAVSGSTLQRHGVADVQDLSLLAAGVTVTNLGPGRDKVLLRGLSDGPLTGHTQSTVGLYLGDLRLTYNAPDPDLPLIDIARVEVLRGPQGSLYGAGSIGGILQVIPNSPDATTRSGWLSVGLATTRSGSASTRAEGVFNQPIADGAGGLRLAAWRIADGGYIDNLATGERAINRSRRTGARLAARLQPRDDLILDATLINQSITTRDAHYATADAGPFARATRNPEPHDNDFLALSLAARWNPAWGHVTFSLGGLDHNVGATYDAATAPAVLYPAGAHPTVYVDGNEIRGLVGEARAVSVGPGRFHWTIGAFAAAGDQRLDARLETEEDAQAYAEARRDRLFEAALFGEVSYDLTPEVTVTAGGRAFNSRLRTRSAVTLAGPLRDFTGRTHYRGFAPKALIAWRPAPDLTLYAQAAEGYRTAGFNTAGPPGQAFGEAGGTQPLRRYGGDELWSYEAGGRWRSPELGIAVRAAAFVAEWTDIQADLVLPSGLPYTANLGDGRSDGIEAEISYTRGPFSLAAAWVRQAPELRRADTGLPAPPEVSLPGVPETAWSLTGSYAAPLGDERTLDLSASYAHVGRSRLAFDAATAPTMGGYGEVRLAAALSWGETRARLFVDNALDRRGDTLAFGNPFSFRTESQTTPQRPRTVGLELRRGF